MSSTGTAARRSTRTTRALSVLAATAAAVALWVVAAPIGGADLTVQQGDQEPMEIGVALVVATALVAGLAGWGLLAVLGRATRRPRTVWTVVAVIALALSLLPPLTAEATSGAHVTLVLMHIVVGAVLIAGLRRTATERRPA